MLYYSWLLCLGLALAATAFPGVDRRVKKFSFAKPWHGPVHVKVTVEVTEDKKPEDADKCTPECPEHLVCEGHSCKDPCLSDSVCGPNEECHVRNHVASCSCKEGYYGDTNTGCNKAVDHDSYFEVTNGHFYVKDSRYINFTSAKDVCLRHGMQLATFNTESDFNKLRTLLRNNGEYHEYYKQYIGAIYNNQREQFDWESTGQPLTYTLWADGEPTPKGPEGKWEDCVVIEKATNYKMNNVECGENAGFICEKKSKHITPKIYESEEIKETDKQTSPLPDEPEELTEPNEETSTSTLNLDEMIELNAQITQQLKDLDKVNEILHELTLLPE